MAGYFITKATDCKNCHKCIRHCPVKAISFSQNRARILEEECILCGRCRANCPQDAKSIRDDLPAAKRLAGGAEPVYVSLAPSFAAAFPDVGFGALEAALLALGFSGVEETARGATVVKKRYEELLREGKQSVILSSCCHSVNTLIRKYYPESAPHLAKVVTPMHAHGRMLKKAYPGCRVVFIGPCISKKAEAEEYPGAVDCVLTFEDLARWMEEEGVTPAPAAGYDRPPASRARVFPTTGGVIDSMDIAADCGYSVMAADGMESCMAVLEDIAAGGVSKCFIELSACAGSCVSGPAMGARPVSPVKDRLAVRRIAGGDDFAVEPVSGQELECKLPVCFIGKGNPGSAAVRDVLAKMGKTLPEHEFNCGSCGYETCREKAVAVLAGKAEINMCLPYLMSRAESFSDYIISNTPNGIIVLNRAMEIQQINEAACRILNVQEPGDVVGREVVCILDPVPFAQVLVEGRDILDNYIYLPEYRKHIRLTILLDQESDILIAFMRDVTEKYAQRAGKDELGRQAVEIADRVIEKQMRTVQEIASLLGETTAETKVALERLKETLVT